MRSSWTETGQKLQLEFLSEPHFFTFMNRFNSICKNKHIKVNKYERKISSLSKNIQT